ncbi:MULTISPECIES: RtcB family protein [Haloarcula]|uniref:tRNA-splicing ligase RtcB n=1 Tax=Haloarcula pellucida TaxID=1427151 RepID=A0A830GHS0_9EURY|nr:MULTISPECIES: RtcB family protein [Halomicroarcula]MBX0347733.1 RtcB family protein [Halomicroarcula pellucida]MDS0276334.1 RtcB family protein [Halomicroarcula sp. S1AR25-4]GGN90050.1 RNA-splicing ligase RtcB [Halomicroarcula pellucida]
MVTYDTGSVTLERVREYVWEIPPTDGMRVPARVLASEQLLDEISDDKTLEQLQNSAHLPGVQKYTLCMPDGHQGYGFPVGGVAGIDTEDGCISPGAVGYDINCGVRMLTTPLEYADVQGHEEELVDRLFAAVPSGLGGGGVYEGSVEDVDAILERGMDWALEQGYATEADLEHCEDEGYRPEGDASVVSEKAKNRGKEQVGSLGSGNHFLEVQRVTDVYREDVATEFGLSPDQIVVLIHCGSRGLGHQVCTDYLRQIEKRHGDLLAQLPDKELAAAPAGSQLADEYYRAMCAAINFAWVNRQLVMHRTRDVLTDVFGVEREDLELLYDVAHNIAKKEVHDVDGEDRELYVHRKGATRAFPAGRPELPPAYADVGQPVIIPGSMGAGSYVLRGGENSLAETFGSTAHGAGRLMSRTQAKQEYWGEDVRDDLRDHQHVYVKAQSGATVAEEAPGVYKDVDEVVRVSDALGIGDRVARTFPVCNVKG